MPRLQYLPSPFALNEPVILGLFMELINPVRAKVQLPPLTEADIQALLYQLIYDAVHAGKEK